MHYTKRQLEGFKKDAMACMMDTKWVTSDPKHVNAVMEGLYEMSHAAIGAVEKMEQTAEYITRRTQEQMQDALMHGRTLRSSTGVLQSLSAEMDIAASKAETAMQAVKFMLKMVPELDKQS